jgi:predicted nucleic acid-binding protein
VSKRIVVDTGPLVAFLNSADGHHEWSVRMLEQIEPPLLTCEAVLSEACFRLRRARGGPQAVLEMVASGAVQVSFSLEREIAAVSKLMTRYASVPMSLADACLVRMMEIEPRSTLLTLDSDFKIYRRNRRQAIPLVTPR